MKLFPVATDRRLWNVHFNPLCFTTHCWEQCKGGNRNSLMSSKFFAWFPGCLLSLSKRKCLCSSWVYNSLIKQAFETSQLGIQEITPVPVKLLPAKMQFVWGKKCHPALLILAAATKHIHIYTQSKRSLEAEGFMPESFPFKSLLKLTYYLNCSL